MQGDQYTTPVDIITPHGRYTGRLVNRGYRVSDLLSEGSTDVVQLYDAVISTPGQSASIRCSDLLLRKEEIVFALPLGGHEAPSRRLNKLAKNESFQAIVALGGYVVSGVLHLPPRTASASLLNKDAALPGFLAMTSAAVHSGPTDFVASDCDTIILRRWAIAAVELASTGGLAGVVRDLSTHAADLAPDGLAAQSGLTRAAGDVSTR